MIGLKKANAWLFGYAVVLGTSAPVLLSRCQGGCAGCGGCVLLLGLVPLVAFAAVKDRVRRLARRLGGPARRDGALERPLRAGRDPRQR